MKGMIFYLEQSGNVIVRVRGTTDDGFCDVYTVDDFEGENVGADSDDIVSTDCAIPYLLTHCTRISEDAARDAHPNMFKYLKSLEVSK